MSIICWFLILKLEVRPFFVTYMVVDMYRTFLSCVNLMTTFHVLSALCFSFFIVALNVDIILGVNNG